MPQRGNRQYNKSDKYFTFTAIDAAHSVIFEILAYLVTITCIYYTYKPSFEWVKRSKETDSVSDLILYHVNILYIYSSKFNIKIQNTYYLDISFS